MAPCPCCSNLELDACCGPYLSGEKAAPTAEALMRSRYTAFTTADIDYIRRTRHSRSNADWDEKETTRWATESEWLELEIKKTSLGGESDDTGEVEFIARYIIDDEEEDHHENASFMKEKGVWYFVDGEAVKPETFVRETPKVGRNDPCPCGSGKKFKKCCGACVSN